jgi:hypothetical protein
MCGERASMSRNLVVALVGLVPFAATKRIS